jgi:hypothetical protein
VVASPQEKEAQPPQWSLPSQLPQPAPLPFQYVAQSRLAATSSVGEYARDEPPWRWIIEIVDFLDGWHPDAGVTLEIDL